MLDMMYIIIFLEQNSEKYVQQYLKKRRKEYQRCVTLYYYDYFSFQEELP